MRKTKIIAIALLSIISFIYIVFCSRGLFNSSFSHYVFLFSISFLVILFLSGIRKSTIAITNLTFSVFIIFIVTEFITLRMTSFYFHKIPNEIISIVFDTNLDEISSNSKMSKKEIIGAFLIMSNLLALFIPIKTNILTVRFSYNTIAIIIMSIIAILSFSPMIDSVDKIYSNRKNITENLKAIDVRKGFKFNAESHEKEKQIVVIFLGETHRGDFLGINGYYKNTTPNLNKENIISFKNAISQGAYTLQSTPMILSRKGVYDNGIFKEKSIISAYKEAGFKTWYVSYVSRTHVGDNEINLIANEADEYIRDDVKASTLNKILEDGSDKKLIVYKTIGSHYLYHTRYPSNYDVFKPSFNNENYRLPTLEDKVMLENSYANSILYSVDHDVSEFINTLKKHDGIVYLSFISDHGTAIFDDEKSLYGGNTKGNYNLAFFFWFNDAALQKNKPLIDNLKKNENKKITSECFFDTNLSLSNITTTKTKGCSLTKPIKEKKRLVTNGGVYDYDLDIK